MSTTNWTKPVVEEVKMDAEIGSYQQDDRLASSGRGVVESPSRYSLGSPRLRRAL
jgi:hypothetical protein